MNVEIDSLYQGMMDRLSDLRRERSGYEEVLCFYAEVLAAQRAAQQDMVLAEPDLPEENIRLRVREGFSLIARESFPVDIKGAELLFGKLCRISQKGNPLLASAGKALQDAVDRQEFNFAQLISATLTEKTGDIKALADGAGVSPTILCALGRWSMQPSLFAVAVALAGEPLLDDWQRGHCPICGAFPAMAAFVGKEGKRWALCSFCGHVWRMNRVGCPFCARRITKGFAIFMRRERRSTGSIYAITAQLISRSWTLASKETCRPCLLTTSPLRTLICWQKEKAMCERLRELCQ